MRITSRAVGAGFGLLVFLAWTGVAGAGVTCAELVQQPYGGAMITGATMVPAAEGLPGYCKVTATVGRKTDTQIEMDIEVWLPDNWQKRLLHLGGGGFDGTIPMEGGYPPQFIPNYINKPLQNGFALAASNGGHKASDYPNATFYLDYSMTEDYAYVAIDTTLRVAKALIAAYYAERPKYSYFWGCSNGGRGAFNAAAKYPNEYDGVVAASPSRNMPGLSSAWMEYLPAGTLTPGQEATVESAAVAACDGLDGLKDGIISNPDACQFDPSILRCAGAPSDSCLTDPQIAVVNKIFYSDLKLSDGKLIYSRTGVGELVWGPYYGVLGPGYVNYLACRNPALTTWDLNDEYPTLVAVLNGAYGCSADTKALARYLNEDKKMIVVHGTDDTLLSHYDTARTFLEMTEAAGGKGRDNAKYYTVAGMGHCYGGPGPDSFDMVTPLTEWVERGIKPGTITASKLNADGSVQFTRPLCEWPKYPRYRGHGDRNNAVNFDCVMPAQPQYYKGAGD